MCPVDGRWEFSLSYLGQNRVRCSVLVVQKDTKASKRDLYNLVDTTGLRKVDYLPLV